MLFMNYEDVTLDYNKIFKMIRDLCPYQREAYVVYITHEIESNELCINLYREDDSNENYIAQINIALSEDFEDYLVCEPGFHIRYRFHNRPSGTPVKKCDYEVK